MARHWSLFFRCCFDSSLCLGFACQTINSRKGTWPNINPFTTNKLNKQPINVITNRCPADESTAFLSTNSESAQRFTTTAFQFTGNHPFVFIHCHVVICDRNDSLSECRKTCPSSNGRLRKREVHDELIDGYSLGQGPVHLVRRKRDLDRAESCTCNKNGQYISRKSVCEAIYIPHTWCNKNEFIQLFRSYFRVKSQFESVTK